MCRACARWHRPATDQQDEQGDIGRDVAVQAGESQCVGERDERPAGELGERRCRPAGIQAGVHQKEPVPGQGEPASDQRPELGRREVPPVASALPDRQPRGDPEQHEQRRRHDHQREPYFGGAVRGKQGRPADAHPGDQQQVDRHRRQVGDDPDLGEVHRPHPCSVAATGPVVTAVVKPIARRRGGRSRSTTAIAQSRFSIRRRSIGGLGRACPTVARDNARCQRQSILSSAGLWSTGGGGRLRPGTRPRQGRPAGRGARGSTAPAGCRPWARTRSHAGSPARRRCRQAPPTAARDQRTPGRPDRFRITRGPVGRRGSARR